MIQPVPKKVYIYVMVMLSFLCQEAYAVSSIGHKTKRAKWVMVGWNERLLVSVG